MSISKNSNNLQLDTARHSFAHLLAGAVYAMFPEAQFGVGPVIENGCYYDFVLPRVLIPEDLVLLEQKINSLLQRPLEYQEEFLTYDQARELFMTRGQGFKVELINDLENKKNLDQEEDLSTDGGVTIWRISDSLTGEMVFEDLCKGPHIENIKELRKVGFFLDKMSSVYWRGDQERNISMQRIYVLIMETKEDLKQYLEKREDAKKRDHRILGDQMGLFMFSDLVGKGLPLWLEKGTTIKRLLERFIVEEEIRRGYRHVQTPDMASLELYKKSGHYPYYKDSMYAPIVIDQEEYMLRPMTCPHHFQIYNQKPRSYKELPMRIAELAKLYRYEDSGALNGLTRVRCFCLADSHIVCTLDQAKDEVIRALDLIEYCSNIFGLRKGIDYRYELALGDRVEEKKFYKDDQAWDQAEGVLRQALQERGENFVEEVGEAAFYGPKIDIQMKNITGKEYSAFTVQYDFVMPKRFELKYYDASQEEQEPVVVHRSSIGAVERVFALLTEFYGGRFPFWLAPTQVKILTINDTVLDYVEQITKILDTTILMHPLKYNEIRYETDTRAESLNKKIKEAELNKIPVIIVIGPKDKEANQVSLRVNLKGEAKEIKIDLVDLKKYIEEL